MQESLNIYNIHLAKIGQVRSAVSYTKTSASSSHRHSASESIGEGLSDEVRVGLAGPVLFLEAMVGSWDVP